MARMNMIEALRSAMDVMLEKDPNVVVFGEDVGYFGGVFRCTDGLQREYGEHRVIDAPIAEGGIVGAAIGKLIELRLEGGKGLVVVVQAECTGEGEGEGEGECSCSQSFHHPTH